MEPFITGWLGVSLAQQEQKNISRANLIEGDYAIGVDNAIWVKPGSATEQNLIDLGVVFGE